MAYRIANALLLTSLAGALVLSGCSKPAEKEAYYVKRGNEFFDKGEYEKARIEYKNAAHIKPVDPELDYRFGLVDEAEGDIRGAFAGFTQAEQQDAHFRPALIKLAEYYLAAEHDEEAKKRIDVALSDAPEDPAALAMQAAYLVHQKDYASAEQTARASLSHDPANIFAFSVLTGVYAAKGDDTKALEAVNEGIAHNPKNLALYLLKAGIYERQNDLAKIADTYQTIFQIAPDNPQYRAKLASIYLNAGRIDDAETALRAGVTALPKNWDMKHQIVIFLNEHRNMEAAEKEIRGYMKSNSDHPELNNWLVELYMSHNEADRAVTFLNDVIAKNPSSPEGLSARAILARIDYMKGDQKTAGQLADDVLQQDPNNLDARFIKVHIEFDNGSYQNTITDLRSIIRDRPKSKEALHLLSETLVLQNHLDLAIDTMSQLVELDPLNSAARVRLAQLYHQNGDSKHAMDMLFFLTKTEPNYALAWETTARIAIDIKDWATAQLAIDTLDKLEGQHLTAVFLRGALLDRTDKKAEAIEQYKQVIAADPGTPLAEHALKALVLAYQQLKRPEEATSYIESLKTSNPVVQTILGESRLVAGKSDLAATDFDNAIAAHTSRQEPYLDRAKMFLFDHKPEQAMEVLKQGAEAAPADIRAPILEAEILEKQGKYQEAIALYEVLLNRNPELDGVANNLAEIIADYKYDDSASLAQAQQIAERFSASTNPLLLDTLAWVYYRQGNLDQAQTIMQRAVTQGTELPPQIHYHNAAILLKGGRTEDAKKELQKAVASDALPYPGLEDAKKMLMGL